MAISRIIDSTFPSLFDTVAVYDQTTFLQVFPRARVLKATVKQEAKVMEHPLETGAVITDHRIILPTEIELSMLVQSRDYSDTYRNIKQYFLNATLLTVQTNADVYVNQLIAGMPHEEDPDQFSTLTVALKLKQVQFAQPQYGVVPKNPSNSAKIDRGVLQPKERSQSVLADLEDFIRKR